MNTVQIRIDELVSRFGSLSAVSAATGIPTPNLCKARQGREDQIGDDNLAKLGIKRAYRYEKTASAAASARAIAAAYKKRQEGQP